MQCLRKFMLMFLSLFSLSYAYSDGCEGGCEDAPMMTTIVKTISSLHKIIVNFPMDVVIQQGDKNAYYVTGNKASIKELKIQAKNGELVFKTKALEIGATHIDNITAYITVSHLQAIQSTGRTTIIFHDLLADMLNMNCSGRTIVQGELTCNHLHGDFAGYTEARLKGHAQMQDITIAGTGMYDSAEMDTDVMRLNIQGAVQSRVMVTDRLDATLSGKAFVVYSGKPKTVNKNLTGGSILRPVK